MVWYQFMPDWRILVLPAFVLLAFCASVGPALWITALNVKYRDFRYVIPFIVQFGLYVSPVGFSSSVVPEQWRLLYSLNPMVGVIDGFRWCILGGQSELYVPGLAISIGVTGFFLWFGIHQFRKMEKSFADSNLSWSCAHVGCRHHSRKSVEAISTWPQVRPRGIGPLYSATRRHRSRGPQLRAQSSRPVSRATGRSGR